MIAHCSRLIFIQSWNARKGRNQWSLGYYLIGKPRRFTIASARNRIAKASMRMSRERLSSGMGSSIGQTAFWNSVVARADSRRDFLKKHLPANASYIGVDISETMVALAKERLARFGSRAELHLTDGSPRFDFESGAFDRFVSNYVFDLLKLEDIRAVLQEAWRVLSERGLLGSASLTHGFTCVSRVVESIWTTIYAIRPMFVGGCRPISLSELVSEPNWRIRYDARFSSYGVPSEVLIAQKM